MSGLVVICQLDGRPVDRALFERMLGAIAHRGPDGCGRWIGGPIALGCQMFHTTPEALRESQPLGEPDGNLRMIFDGRVDNRAELAAALGARGILPRDDTDVELALRAYECFGQEAPLRIIGDFAFAVWDAARRELFCARDPIGVRTFYYWCDGRTFLAATELQQLFAHALVSTDPDEGVVGEYLCGTLISREDTLFRQIKRLPASHLMVVSANGICKRAYFDLDPRARIRCRDDAEYAACFRDLFAQAVRCRMRTIGGLGAHLSGGLDSTAVVGMAAALRREGICADRPFETFSLLFDHPDLDERTYIEATVRMLALTANYPEPVPVDLRMCLETLGRYRDFAEYPNGGMWHRLWPAARDKGIRVLLSGTGSDEWLSGSVYVYADMLRAGQWLTLIRRVRHDAYRFPYAATRSAPDFFLRHALWPMMPPRLRKLARSLSGREAFPPFIRAGFAQRIDLADRLQSQPRRPSGMSFGQYALYENFHNGWVAHGMDMFDRATAAFTIEERHPFHDRRLYEFLMALPDDQRARDFQRKFILRNAMRPLVPDAVMARRDKADFSILFIKALERMGGEHFFDWMSLADAGWVDRDQFRKIYRQRTADYLGSNIWPLWTTFSLELWHRLVIGGLAAPSADAVANA